MSASTLSSSVSNTGPLRILTELDHVRITKLLARQSEASEKLAALQQVLEMADLVRSQEVAPDVVTMYARVQVAGADGSLPRELTLCYPADANTETGHVSVLSPITCAPANPAISGSTIPNTPTRVAVPPTLAKSERRVSRPTQKSRNTTPSSAKTSRV